MNSVFCPRVTEAGVAVSVAVSGGGAAEKTMDRTTGAPATATVPASGALAYPVTAPTENE